MDMEHFIEVIVNREQQLSNEDESCSATDETGGMFYADHSKDEESPNTDTGRRRNRVPNPITWKRKRNALLRERGQSYLGIKTVVDEEGRKWCTEVPRGGRKMKPRCECKSPAFECKKVSDEIRQRLFDEFWALSWEEKRTYMSRLVVLGSVMRPRNRKDASFSRRSKSLKYYFEADDTRYRVCKTMFLNTFDLSQWSVHGWPKKWSSSADDHSASADVDCLLDESETAASSWFEEFIARLPKEANTGSSSKKRKTSSPSTDSSKVDVTDEWISESEGENERVESTTISFVDVSAVNCDSDDENVDSVPEPIKYHECETSTSSADLTSQQPDLHHMITDMSRRLDEMQEKFDKRLQSVESQLSDFFQNKNRETSTTDVKPSIVLDRSMSSEEQEADSLTESQADAERSPNVKLQNILPHITSHVENCFLTSCDTCRQLESISRDIVTNSSSSVNSSSCSSESLPEGRRYRTPRFPRNRYLMMGRLRRGMKLTENSTQCNYCLRNYDDNDQLNYHINRHSIDETKPCCHCSYRKVALESNDKKDSEESAVFNDDRDRRTIITELRSRNRRNVEQRRLEMAEHGGF